MAANLKTFAGAIRRIPRGKVATYGQVAAAAGFPRAARQVVWALNAFQGLPWHRVVGAGGAIRLPGEQALEQRLRLEMEGITFRGKRVDMARHQWKRQTSREASG
jgi:methylated-DNA-protein-cysteine methyltransferase related protein